MKTEHILIIRFSAIGDVAMTVPVVYSLATQYPDLRITMLSRPFARPLFENLAPNVGFMEADIKGEYRGIKGLNALYRRLLAKNFTAIADLHNVLRSDYLRLRFNFNQFKVAHINKHRAERKRLTQHKNKVLEPIQSSIDNYAEVFRELGYPITNTFTTLLTPEEASLRLLPEAIGTWTFDNTADLMAGTGVATLKAAKHSKGNVQTYNSPADANITPTAGPANGNGAILVPKNSSLLMTSNLQATTLSTYSILWDVKADNFSPYIPLLQNDLTNTKDGSLFTNKNMVGLNAGNLGYHGNLYNGNWYRILFVVENNYANVYVNGVKVGASTSPIPLHWQLTTGALFFADEDGEEEKIETAEIRFWNVALTAEQASQLGKAGE